MMTGRSSVGPVGGGFADAPLRRSARLRGQAATGVENDSSKANTAESRRMSSKARRVSMPASAKKPSKPVAVEGKPARPLTRSVRKTTERSRVGSYALKHRKELEAKNSRRKSIVNESPTQLDEGNDSDATLEQRSDVSAGGSGGESPIQEDEDVGNSSESKENASGEETPTPTEEDDFAQHKESAIEEEDNETEEEAIDWEKLLRHADQIESRLDNMCAKMNSNLNRLYMHHELLEEDEAPAKKCSMGFGGFVIFSASLALSAALVFQYHETTMF